jgi:hypothetical protein
MGAFDFIGGTRNRASQLRPCQPPDFGLTLVLIREADLAAVAEYGCARGGIHFADQVQVPSRAVELSSATA